MKIKNCPFCDGEDPIAQYDSEGIWCVICQYCDAEGPPGWIQWPKFEGEFNTESSEQKAIERWNIRGRQELKDFIKKYESSIR